MTHSTASARRLELRSLRFGVWADAVMTLSGLSAPVLTGSSALLLNGPRACDALIGGISPRNSLAGLPL